MTLHARRSAGAAACLICLATFAAMPVAARNIGMIPPFLPMYTVAVFMVPGFTAFFLALQYRSSREPHLACLSGAYGLQTFMVLPQLLTYPSVFAGSGLSGGGPQAAIWIWAFWHGCFPLLVLVAMLMRVPEPQRWQSAMGRTGPAIMHLAPYAGAGLAGFAILKGSVLPRLVTGNSYANMNGSITDILIIAMSLAALAGCVRITRLKDLFGLWLAVALLANVLGTLLTMLGARGYSVGWYGGRMLDVVSSLVVLVTLLYEVSKIHRELRDASSLLYERSIRDPLTGAFNRGYFVEQLDREFRLALRECRPLSVIITDVDHFKQYNDSFGHQMGDDCLVRLVAAIQSAIRRPSDFVARYGGEEFVVVLPNTDAAGARTIADSLTGVIADLKISRNFASGEIVTVSIGIATLDDFNHVCDAEELVRCADMALYDAKRGGRDRIEIFKRAAA